MLANSRLGLENVAASFASTRAKTCNMFCAFFVISRQHDKAPSSFLFQSLHGLDNFGSWCILEAKKEKMLSHQHDSEELSFALNGLYAGTQCGRLL